MITVTVTLDPRYDAKTTLAKLQAALNQAVPEMFRQEIGPYLKADTQRRIRTQDYGRWAPASKWIRAKKGSDRILYGQDNHVDFRVFPRRLELIHRSPSYWNITQHHTGFTKQPVHHRFTIPIKDPVPLGLPGNAKVFSFVMHNPSVVPPRKIWPTEGDVMPRIAHSASLWIQKTINRVPGVRP